MDPEGARLLTIFYYTYRKPRLCINIHHYAAPIGSTAQRAAGSELQRHCWSVLVKFRRQVLNR